MATIRRHWRPTTGEPDDCSNDDDENDDDDENSNDDDETMVMNDNGNYEDPDKFSLKVLSPLSQQLPSALFHLGQKIHMSHKVPATTNPAIITIITYILLCYISVRGAFRIFFGFTWNFVPTRGGGGSDPIPTF